MEQTDKKERGLYLVKRLLNDYVVKHKGKISFAVFCMVIEAAATAANAWMMEPVLDKIFLEKNAQMLLIIPIAVFGLAVVKGLATYGQNIKMKFIGQRIITEMQLDLYQHLLKSDLSYFQQNSSGKLLSRFSNDINLIKKSVSNIMTNVIKESFTLIFLIALMFYNSWELALVAFVVFPLGILPMVKMGKKMRKVTGKTQEELGDFTAQLDDTFQGIRVVKAYTREEYEVKKATGFVENIFKLYIKAARIESFSSPGIEILAGTAVAAVIWYGGYQVISGVTTPGAFFSFIAALIMAYKPMKSISGTNTSIQEGLASVKRFYHVLDIEPKIKDRENASEYKGENTEVVFENVSFSYETAKSALRDMNFVVPAGKRVALVGESGSGKSTIMNLLMRFYDPATGEIRIGGMDARSYSIKSLRENMAFVNQETFLFDDSVKANIAYGRPDASDDDIVNAAIAAAAHDFIVAMPQGYDTMIGQHGMRLSGGQRQRLTIARAMLKNSPILLLDEATSALDPVSEHQVQQALDRLMRGRTTIVIAHRLSTIINSDIIFVVAGGKIVESGTHNQLLTLKGEYKRLFDKQFGNLTASLQ